MRLTSKQMFLKKFQFESVNHASHPIPCLPHKVSSLYYIAHIIRLNPFNFYTLPLVPPLILSP